MKIENLTELYDITDGHRQLTANHIDYMSPRCTYVIMNLSKQRHLQGRHQSCEQLHDHYSVSVSVIWDDHSTNYRIRVPLCLYENLSDDIATFSPASTFVLIDF